MATTAEVCFCTDPGSDRRPLAALIGLTSAIRELQDEELRFQVLRVYTENRLKPVFHLRVDLGLDELLTTLEPWDSPANSLSVKTAIRGYTSPGAGHPVERTLFAASIGSSGGQRPGRTGDWWTDGDAQLFIDNVTPYVFPPAADVEPSEHRDVRANIDVLVGFLSAAVGSLGPLGFKVHTDAGQPFPFNAHMAYFAKPEEALRDVQSVVALFESGHPILELPPLGEAAGDLADFVFHLWRGREEQRRLRQALDHAVRGRRRPVADVIHAVASASVRFGAAAQGLAVFDGHAPFNTFLEGFYLDLLGGDGPA